MQGPATTEVASGMPQIEREDRGQVALLRLNRPEVRNALSSSLRDALQAELERLRDDPQVRAVVLTGTGSSFCSGMDLGELEGLLARSEAQHLEDSAALARLFRTIYTFPKPVVAAVNGHAVAGGAGLVSVCDLAVMSSEARIGYTESRIGFVAALVGVFLTRSVGERRARELLLEARLLSAGEAREMGLVNEVADPGSVLPRALERAEALAANSPESLARTKELLIDIWGLPLDDALDRAARANAAARTTGDMREGVRAFLEKRPPEWKASGG